ncbi:MAG: class II fumarate hydratase [Planctomycetota bacterium]
MSTRIEKDSMGEMSVPEHALYGASTQRAVLNFPISGRAVPREIVEAFAHLKTACARVNNDLGVLDERRTRDIVDACGQILRGLPAHVDGGGFLEHFPVDVFQTGSGTSTNMNVNEVVANLACVAHGQPIGRSKDPAWYGDEADGGSGGVHPNDHVNMGQSSNDTFPTAIHLAAVTAINARLIPAVAKLAAALGEKAEQFDSVVKIGRTHLQDATPIRLGQEFGGYASQMDHALKRLAQATDALCELPIGGTAVGTGINTDASFGRRVAEKLAAELDAPFREADNHFEAQHAKDACVEASGLLKTIAVSLSKIANDIRWMGSGPRCGIGELKLPAVQPGSSIMPGKVNPVICEAVVMVSCQVVGNDAAITMGGMGGVGSVLDLNVAMPVIAANLLDSIGLIAGACDTLTDNCLLGPGEGLQADEARANELIEGSLAMCTSLVPVIGYDASAALAYEAYRTGKTIRELATEQGVVPKERLDELLDPVGMTGA